MRVFCICLFSHLFFPSLPKLVTAFDWIVLNLFLLIIWTIQSNAMTNFGHARHQYGMLPPEKQTFLWWDSVWA